jgi:hypothetical protein
MVCHKFAKIYICRRGPRRQGHNAAAHGGRSRQESGPLAWYKHSVVPHEVRGLAPWATTLGPSAVGHDARVWLPI